MKVFSTFKNLLNRFSRNQNIDDDNKNHYRAAIGASFTSSTRTTITNRGDINQVVIGNFVTLLDDELTCYKSGSIRIGNYVWMSLRGQIISCTNVTIGNYCIFARDVYISDTNEHPTNFIARREQTIAYLEKGELPDRYQSKTSPIKIGNDVWVGERAIILKGVNLGEGCIVGAGSVVTGSFPAHCLIAGNPAKIVRILSNEEVGEVRERSIH